jgi:hydrogenase maturation protein HypF
MWLEHQARSVSSTEAYPFPFVASQLDFRPLLQAVLDNRAMGCDIGDIARAFHRSVAQGVVNSALELSERAGTDILVLSGGVFQNDLLLHDVKSLLEGQHIRIWMNQMVPPNDGGISLGQAALAAFAKCGQHHA